MTPTIDTWVFDLDNTLYPPSAGLMEQVNVRIREYVCDLLDVSEDEAREVQKRLCASHGTTLRGLMATEGVDADDYLAFEETLDYSVLPTSSPLEATIAELPGRAIVFTNGSEPYARRVLNRLGLDGVLDTVFDIRAAQLLPKPFAETYERFIAEFDIDVARSIFFDDMATNLTVPQQLGMHTGLVTPEEPSATTPFEVLDREPLSLRVTDLGATLQQLAAA